MSTVVRVISRCPAEGVSLLTSHRVLVNQVRSGRHESQRHRQHEGAFKYDISKGRCRTALCKVVVILILTNGVHLFFDRSHMVVVLERLRYRGAPNFTPNATAAHTRTRAPALQTHTRTHEHTRTRQPRTRAYARIRTRTR